MFTRTLETFRPFHVLCFVLGRTQEFWLVWWFGAQHQSIRSESFVETPGEPDLFCSMIIANTFKLVTIVTVSWLLLSYPHLFSVKMRSFSSHHQDHPSQALGPDPSSTQLNAELILSPFFCQLGFSLVPTSRTGPGLLNDPACLRSTFTSCSAFWRFLDFTRAEVLTWWDRVDLPLTHCRTLVWFPDFSEPVASFASSHSLTSSVFAFPGPGMFQLDWCHLFACLSHAQTTESCIPSSWWDTPPFAGLCSGATGLEPCPALGLQHHCSVAVLVLLPGPQDG